MLLAAFTQVKLFNVWCLVDSCLGAGYTDKTFKECFELFYFATPPEQLVLTHIPNDDKWQLLQRPYSLEDHQYRIVPHPSYFKFGKSIVKHHMQVLFKLSLFLKVFWLSKKKN